MIGKLVLENLKHRPVRSLLSVLLIGVPVTLILSLVGLTHGMSEDAQRRQKGVGADIIVRGSGTSSAISMSSASIREGIAGAIEKQPHVVMAMGVFLHPLDLPLVITGLDLEKFKQMSGGFTYLSGHPLVNDNDILIDQDYADQKKAHVGSTISLMNKSWHVAGIIDSGKLARIVVKLKMLQELDAAHGNVSQVYVKVDNEANIPVVVKELETLLPDNPV